MAVGKLSEGVIEDAALFATFGIDPLRFLYTTDSLERAMLKKLLDMTMKNKEILDEKLAVNIANQVGKLF